MSNVLEKVLNILIIRRKIVLTILVFILLTAFGFGFLYQSKINKEEEARDLFDQAWQQATVIIQANQEKGKLFSDPKLKDQVMKMYKEAINSINLLISDYSNTIGGAQAALLLVVLDPFFENGDVGSIVSKDEYLRVVKKKHRKFWGVIIAFAEGIEAEKHDKVGDAIQYYKEALEKDKQKYIADHSIMAIARNYEMLHQYKQAQEYYQLIEKEYPNSEWLSIAMAKDYLLSKKSE